MEVDELEDAPQKVQVLKQEELDDHGDVLSLQQEKFTFADWAIAAIFLLPHAEVEDGEGQDRQVDRF